jgi:regulation of enolase protein 1 (concanavalin A-like superfamily)
VNDAAEGSPWKGAVWSFTTADFLVVDNFESYVDDVTGRIFQSWIDGWGYTEPAPGNPGNGTSSTVGYTDPPFAETSVVHGGGQSMPFDYNNINQPYYSETERTFDAGQNWKVNEVTDLVLWFQGYAVRYLDDGTTITMSAAGDDIWNNADAFRFAYKRINGDGSMTVKVNSVVNTNAWAKAGIMVRESLTPGSANATNIVSASSGVQFQYRAFTDDVSATASAQTGLFAPYWVRLTRTGNTFKGEMSADGKTWSIIGTDAAASSHDVVMGSNIYIGLCLTSHNTNAKIATTAVFSDVKTTGGVSGQWQVADVGMVHPGNDPAQLYVALQDSAGKVAVVNHPDANATLTTAWAQWKIPLSEFTGVNVGSVKKMHIGVGDRKAPQVGGHGKLFIDDIQVVK